MASTKALFKAAMLKVGPHGAAPSSNSIDLSSSFYTGTTNAWYYTPPADGYISIHCTSEAKPTQGGTIAKVMAGAYDYFPCFKGVSFILYRSSTVVVDTFKFVYTIGGGD